MKRRRGFALMGLACCLATMPACALLHGGNGANPPTNVTPPSDVRPVAPTSTEQTRVDSTYQVRSSTSGPKVATSGSQNQAFRIGNPPSAANGPTIPANSTLGSTYPGSNNPLAAPPPVEPRRENATEIKLPGGYENPVLPMGPASSGVASPPTKPTVPEAPTAGTPRKPQPDGPQIVYPSTPGARELVASAGSTKEPSLLAFMRYYLAKQPDEAIAQLRGYEKTRQDLLLALLSMATTLTEGDTSKLEPKQVAVILNQLRGIAAPLLPKAPLQFGAVELALTVKGYGQYARMPPDHLWSPDDFVQMYVEVQNFSFDFNNGHHEICLSGMADILDADNRPVPNTHFEFAGNRVPNYFTSAVREFHRVYSFYLPKSLQPGKYTLRLQVKDEPTQRIAVHDFNLVIGAPGRRL